MHSDDQGLLQMQELAVARVVAQERQLEADGGRWPHQLPREKPKCGHATLLRQDVQHENPAEGCDNACDEQPWHRVKDPWPAQAARRQQRSGKGSAHGNKGEAPPRRLGAGEKARDAHDRRSDQVGFLACASNPASEHGCIYSRLHAEHQAQHCCVCYVDGLFVPRVVIAADEDEHPADAEGERVGKAGEEPRVREERGVALQELRERPGEEPGNGHPQHDQLGPRCDEAPRRLRRLIVDLAVARTAGRRHGLPQSRRRPPR
mmetsp:Transcript_50291/g.144987  ORF Transcript_50291/g.144987 Transcript_50291/m.144987 type:complete len:262 (-) Transcript_50291:69-854(-)